MVMTEIELLQEQLKLMELEKAKINQLLDIEQKLNKNLTEQNEKLQDQIREIVINQN